MEYKSETATLDFQQDWSSWLSSGDGISTSTWTVETGLTVDSESNTTTVATAIISGGTNGKTYQVKNSIVTSNGLDEEAIWFIKIQDQIT